MRFPILGLRSDPLRAIIDGTPADDSNLVGTGGDDEIRGLAGDDDISGQGGNDFLLGGSGVDAISGNGGSDVIRGLGGADIISGGAGNDFLRGDDGDDTIDGGSGRDRINGGAGDDILVGGLANDRLLGNVGDDTLFLDEGDDKLFGGAGDNDTVVAADLPGLAFTIDLTAGVATGLGVDSLSGIENAVGGLEGDVLTGNGQANRLDGRAGNDLVFGMGGDDHIVASVDEDYLDGGDGNDTVDFSMLFNPLVLADLELGTAYDALDFDHELVSIENLIGTMGTDELWGDANPNVLRDGLGADDIRGRGGDDTLIREGGDGDTYDGGEGIDTLQIAPIEDVYVTVESVQESTENPGQATMSGGASDATGTSGFDSIENFGVFLEEPTGEIGKPPLGVLDYSGAAMLNVVAMQIYVSYGPDGLGITNFITEGTATAAEDGFSAYTGGFREVRTSLDFPTVFTAYLTEVTLVGSAFGDAFVALGVGSEYAASVIDGNGGEGDTLVISEDQSALVANLSTGFVRISIDDGADYADLTVIDIDDIGGGNSADFLVGDDGANKLFDRYGLDGSPGLDSASDRLFGGAGDDTLTSYGGEDELLGQAGEDTIVLKFADPSVEVSVDGGADTDILVFDGGVSVSDLEDPGVLDAFEALGFDRAELEAAMAGDVLTAVDVGSSLTFGAISIENVENLAILVDL